MSTLPSLGPRGEGWVALQAALLGAVGIAGLRDMSRPSWHGPARVASIAAGAVLLARAIDQARRGLRDLGRDNLTPLPHPTDGARLVESGIYRRVRHPIYGSLILGAIGWALLTASTRALLLAAALVPFFGAKATLEERWLEERFSAYAAYRRRTSRFIAGLG